MPSSTTLHETQNYRAVRQGRHFIVNFKQAHQVLSTSDINGGQNSNLETLVNFNSVEANGHDSRFEEILSLSNDQYHQQLADTLKIDAGKMASMGTAANINNLVHVQKSFRDITLDAFVTAGVKSNALRAGDTARWYQGSNGNEFVKDSGTINIILMVDRTLTPGALAKAATIIAEAKSAALTELAVPSKQSSHIATGTGTDQYAIASPQKSALVILDSASGHLKLGELIGTAVREAVIEAIGIQNGLERSDTRRILHALGRFGLSQETLLAKLNVYLEKDAYELFEKNQRAVFSDPKLVATAYAYASVLDRLEYGTLPKHIQNDVLLDQAVNAAIATSGKSQHWQRFRNELNSIQGDTLEPFIKAMAIGWRDKWEK